MINISNIRIQESTPFVNSANGGQMCVKKGIFSCQNEKMCYTVYNY